jgi:NAD(P)-dependent dehydrogenase (short-subunit alcohol dehydrogenase family)
VNTLTRKVAIVTGGTSGIGRATALALAREGAMVAISGRREDDGAAIVDAIKSAGGEAMFVRTDVTQEADVAALVAATVRAYGRLDVAFNNAGTGEGRSASIHERTAPEFERVMATNVLGVFLALKYEIAAMLENGGAIVNNSSVSGLVGFAGSAIYVASKHAVIGLTKSAALEYATRGIRINAVCPGGTETPLMNRITGGAQTERHRQYVDFHPIGRMAQPEEIAAAVVWLCSERASFVTGQALAVDGGWTTR